MNDYYEPILEGAELGGQPYYPIEQDSDYPIGDADGVEVDGKEDTATAMYFASDEIGSEDYASDPVHENAEISGLAAIGPQDFANQNDKGPDEVSALCLLGPPDPDAFNEDPGIL